MDDVKRRALQERLENAVMPRGIGGVQRNYLNTPTSAKLPDWNFWKHSPEAMLWQACALALNFDPDSIRRHPQEWMAGGRDVFQSDSFPSSEAAQQHDKLLRLLEANLNNRQHFTPTHNNTVRLSEFAAWCAPVVRDVIGRDIPPELAALEKDAPQATLAAKVEAAPVASPSGNGWMTQAQAETSTTTANNKPLLPRVGDQIQQEDEILRVIRDVLKIDPLNMPKNTPGKSGIKADVRDKLSWEGTIFEKAWERVTTQKGLAKYLK